MSDHEHETFESADAGASLTYPQQAGTIRKNGYIVINGKPCKVVDVATSKTGKHGHAKCHFVAIDIFTGKKYEDLTPSSHNCEVPNISRTEYSLVDINDEGYTTLMLENGTTREDLKLPSGTDDYDKLAETLVEEVKAEKDIQVVVLKSMGTEVIHSYKVTQGTGK